MRLDNSPTLVKLALSSVLFAHVAIDTATHSSLEAFHCLSAVVGNRNVAKRTPLNH